MKTASHLLLGRYLADGLGELRGMRRLAFLAGCAEPDYNIITYLRGSMRHRPLAGHSFEGAGGYLQRAMARLRKRGAMRPSDYFRLGKVIHYVADAFTYAHNANFPGSLRAHRGYEGALKRHLEEYLKNRRPHPRAAAKPTYEALREAHARYAALPPSPQKDIRYAVALCGMLFSAFAHSPGNAPGF